MYLQDVEVKTAMQLMGEIRKELPAGMKQEKFPLYRGRWFRNKRSIRRTFRSWRRKRWRESGYDNSRCQYSNKHISYDDTGFSGNEYAIGYTSLGALNDTVKAVKIGGVDASAENVKNGSYEISRPFNIAVKEGVSDAAKDFMGFIMSEEGQAIIEERVLYL